MKTWKNLKCEICRTISSCDRHHIIPRAEGGPNVKWNLVMLCVGCHRKCTIGEIIIKGKHLTSGGYIIDYMDLNTSGIYAIRNVVNGKVYIGSSVNMYHRKGQHSSDLRNNRHRNPYLQNAWNKHGEKNFVFEPLEYVEEDELIEKEEIWMAKFRNQSYNLAEISRGNVRLSIETREKMSKAHKGKIISEETRKKIGKFHKGKIVSEETRKRIGLANKRRFESEEARQQMSKSCQGKILSEATKQKISEARKGMKLSETAKQKISQKLKGKYIGRKLTEETKQKMSEAASNRMYRNNLQLFLFQ